MVSLSYLDLPRVIEPSAPSAASLGPISSLDPRPHPLGEALLCLVALLYREWPVSEDLGTKSVCCFCPQALSIKA